MEGDQPPKTDPGRSLLGCALNWLSASETAPLPLGALLAELARAFGVPQAGVAELPGGEPIAGRPENGLFPWRERPELLGEVILSPLAVGIRDGEAHWLLVAVGAEDGTGWLLWLHAPAAREWSSEEAAALTLMGEALARRLRRPGAEPRWARQLLTRRRRQRFDEAAAATRRIAHDYGNILTGILGFTELALSQAPQGGPSRGYLDEVSRAAHQAERLTNRLRLFARRSWPSNQPASLATIVAEEARRLAGQFPAVRLEVALPPDLPAPTIDADPLRHVLAQLLDNAAEAITGRGTIRLSARAIDLTADECLDLFGPAAPGPHVEIMVEDDGSGLSAEAQQRLLVEPFFTTKPRQRGYGLAVAYGILSAHHGALAVESAGGGTVARFCLPVAAEPARSEAAAALAEPLTRPFGPDGLQRAARRARERGPRSEPADGRGDEAVRSMTH